MFRKVLCSVAPFTLALAAVACGSSAGQEDGALPRGENASPIAAGGSLDATVDLTVCGAVDAYVAATADVDGALVIDGKPLHLAGGLHVEGEAYLALHAHVCVHAKVAADGRVVVAVVTADASGSSEGSSGAGGSSSGSGSGSGGDCPGGASSGGASSGGASSGGSSSGGSSSGGSSSGGSSSGGASSGGASSGGSSSGGASSGGLGVGGGVDLSADVDLCGKVTAFTAAGAKAGACTVGGMTLPIAAGASLTGEALLTLGANVCVHAHLDASGAITSSSSVALDLDANAKVHACGAVGAYVAASATADGHLALGGCGFAIAAGAHVDAEAMLKVGASVCIDASLDAHGELAACTVSAN